MPQCCNKGAAGAGALTPQRLKHVLEGGEGAPLGGRGHGRLLSSGGNEIGQQSRPGLQRSSVTWGVFKIRWD